MEMASLQKKKTHGKEYWYIVECRRVKGKPRPFVLEYLGNAQTLLRRLRKEEGQKKLKSFSHGAVYALLKIAQDMELPSILKKHLTGQQRGGLPIADTLLAGAIYRSLNPGSKRRFSRWAKGTTLPKLMGFDAAKVTSQHFWDQMDEVSDEAIERIENDIAGQVGKTCGLGHSVLFYDTTNFYTYIATKNHRVSLAQRGHNKQKRHDLKQFNLGLITTREFLLPLLSYVYEGSRNDVSIFPDYLKMMIKRLKSILGSIEDITLVFDKGNNSQKGMEVLEEAKIGYVGSLSIYSHKDLISVPSHEYYPVELSTGGKILAHRSEKMLWGGKHTILIKRSDKLKEGQIRGLFRDINKKTLALEDLKEKLTSPKAKKRKRDQLEKQVDRLLSGQFIKEVIRVTIHERKGRKSGFDIDYQIDEKKKERIIEDIFGKKLLFTNRGEWTDAEIIEAYHGQGRIEKLFRHLKNPYYLAVRPQFHWTDQKIKVHTFICLLGLLLAEGLRKRISEAGIKMSLEEILFHLGNIRESTTIFFTGKRGRPRVALQLEEMDETQEKLFDIVEKMTV